MKKVLKYVLGFAAIAAAIFMFKESSAEIATAGFFGGAAMNTNDLEEFADQNFSSFEGDQMLYTGEGDHFLNFGGAGGFANEGANPRQFVITITNAHADDQTVTLMPGYTWKPGDTDATRKIIADGVFYTDTQTVSGAGSPATIKEFLAFIMANPTSLAGMKITSNNNTSQIDQQLIISDLSPFRTLENRIVNLSEFTDQNSFRDKTVKFPLSGVVLGPETEMTLPIMGSSVVTIVFYCGGVLSTSSALKQKKAFANSTIAKVGLANIQQNVAARSALGNTPQMLNLG